MISAAGTCLFLLFQGAAPPAADAPLEPVTVCELLKNPGAYEGKPILVMGRYSFRRTGRFLGEEACGEPLATGQKPAPVVLGLADDANSAPKVPQLLQIDAKAVERKLERIKRATSLGRFRFGSADYDRWAAVYGQIEKIPQPAVVPAAATVGEPASPPARLLIRGDGAIVFLGSE
jgi:hypothetical protein